MTSAVIVFLLKDGQVCLGEKMRGHGQGKWNGFGGKVEEGESFEQAAKRELFEESGVEVQLENLQKVAEIDYIEDKGDWKVIVYTAVKFTNEPVSTEEMEPRWFKIEEVPYPEMWPNDAIWLPKVLVGEKFKAKFWHDENGKIVKQKFQSINFNQWT